MKTMFLLSQILILVKFIIQIQSVPIPKIIWLYWDSGFKNSKLFTQLCLENYRYYAKLDNWELRELDSTNLNFWLKQIPSFNGLESVDIYPQSQRKQALADLIRLILLQHFGGVWMDANIIVTERFNWINNLKNDPNVDNKFGQYPSVVLFYYPDYGSSEKVVNQDSTILISPGFETWFIAALPKTKLILEWLNQFKAYLKNGFDYKNQRIKQNQVVIGAQTAYGGNYLAVSQAIQVIMQLKQRQIDSKYLSPRKFAVHQYGLWNLNSSVGPYKLFFQANKNLFTLSQMLVRNEPYTTAPKYFIKLTSFAYLILDFVITSNWCPSTRLDNHQSIIYRYLLQNDGNSHNIKFCTIFMCQPCFFGLISLLLVLIIFCVSGIGVCFRRFCCIQTENQNLIQQKHDQH